MALRDKLAERMQPYLEPGEQVRHVFTGQTGPSPWLGALSWLIVLFGAKYRIVAVTDRSITVVNASKLVPSKPKGDAAVAKLPRATPIGPVSGLWGETRFLGERLWVHKRFHKDIAAADAELQAGGGFAQPA
ncbi:MAG: hypothetical protein HYX34_06170 [Actinobacteria bacterium]|nr:hypothetical protein [Actinomycetota bacterium]